MKKYDFSNTLYSGSGKYYNALSEEDFTDLLVGVEDYYILVGNEIPDLKKTIKYNDKYIYDVKISIPKFISKDKLGSYTYKVTVYSDLDKVNDYNGYVYVKDKDNKKNKTVLEKRIKIVSKDEGIKLKETGHEVIGISDSDIKALNNQREYEPIYQNTNNSEKEEKEIEPETVENFEEEGTIENIGVEVIS